MSDFTEELGIIVRLDGTVELANGMKLSGQQISEVGKQLDDYGKKLQQTDKGHKTVTASTKEVGQATAQTARDVTDLGKALANGQWREAATHIGEMATQGRGLSAAMTAALGVGAAVTAVIGTIGYAAYKGAEEERKLNDQLILTGNFAGLVGGQIDTMATKVAGGINGTVGQARGVLAGLVSTGKFTVESLNEVATATQLFIRFSGQSEDQASKLFAGMSRGAAKWAAEMNSTYHFLTIEQFRHIQLLEDQGQKQAAMMLVSKAFSEHVGSDLTRNLGLLERTWLAIERAASSAWTAMKDVGKDKSTDEMLSDGLDYAAKARQGLMARSAGGQAQLAQLDARNLELLRRSERERRTTDDRTAQAQTVEAQIAEDMKKPPKTPRGGGGKSAEQLLIERMNAFAQELEFNRDNATDLMNMSPERRQYMHTKRRLETDFANGPPELRDRIDQTAQDTMGQQQEYRQALARAQERQRTRTTEYSTSDKSVNEDILQRQIDASQAGREMEAETKRLNMALVRDDQARVRAQFQLEADGWRQRIEKTREGTLERQTLEDQYSRWMVARQEQLNEDLKPGWQKMIDGWGDANKMMRDAHDRTMQGVVQSGEDAFVEWSRTGKLNAGNLVDGIIAEFARLQYRKFIAKPLAGFLEGVLGSVFGGGDDGFGTGDGFGNEDIGLFLHEGGMVGKEATFNRRVSPSVWQGAPRYHGGGLVTDEVPIIAKKGEGVFTEQQMAALQPAGSGGTTVNYNPTIQIDARTDRAEVIKLVSQAMRASQAELLDKLDRRTA